MPKRFCFFGGGGASPEQPGTGIALLCVSVQHYSQLFASVTNDRVMIAKIQGSPSSMDFSGYSDVVRLLFFGSHSCEPTYAGEGFEGKVLFWGSAFPRRKMRVHYTSHASAQFGPLQKFVSKPSQIRFSQYRKAP